MPKKIIKDIFSQYTKKIDLIDLEMIIAHVLKKDRVFSITHKDHALTPEQYQKIISLCQKRASGHPLAYIVKKKEFYAREFIVSEDTLIPRQETEDLITAVINRVKNNSCREIYLCDIGTGTGVIAITLKKELDNMDISAQIIATDISRTALSIAKQNTQKHNTTSIKFMQTDLISKNVYREIVHAKEKDIFITANLPYVDSNKKESLLKKSCSRSLQFEPSIALWSDKGGTSHYKKMIKQIETLKSNFPKNKNVHCFIEIDPDQSNSLMLLIALMFTRSSIYIHKDIAKKNRIIEWSFQT